MDEDRRRVGAHRLDSGARVRRHDRRGTGMRQVVTQLVVGLVHADDGAMQAGQRWIAGERAVGDGGQRQDDREGRTLSGLARDGDRAAHQLHQALADRQSQAAAAEAACRGGFGLRERHEQAGERFRRHADAVVLDDKAQDGRVAVGRHGANAGVATPSRVAAAELDGIADQVDEHLAQARRVGQHLQREARVDEQLQVDLVAGRHRQQRVADAFDQFVQCQRLALQIQSPRLDLREVEDLVDDAQERQRRAANDAHGLAVRLGQVAVGQHFDHADHAVHRRADLVAHGGQERALGPIGGLGGFAGLLEFRRALGDATLQVGVDGTDLGLGALLLGDVDAEDRDAIRRRQDAHLEATLQARRKDRHDFALLRRPLGHATLQQAEDLDRLDTGMGLHEASADQRLGRPVGLPRRGAIDVAAAPVGIDDLAALDHVVQGMAISLGALLQRLRHFLALGGVVEGGDHQAHAGLVRQAQADIRWKDAPVLAPTMQARPIVRRAGRRRRQEQPAHQRVEFGAVFVRQQDIDALSDQVEAHPAEHRLRLAVDVHDLAVGIELDRGVARKLEELAQLTLVDRRFPRRPFGVQRPLASLQQGSDQLLVGLRQLRAVAFAQAQLGDDDVLLEARDLGASLPGRVVHLGNVGREIVDRLGWIRRRLAHGARPVGGAARTISYTSEQVGGTRSP